MAIQRAIRHSILAAALLAASAGLAAAQAPPSDQPAEPPKTQPTDGKACGPDGTHATVGQGGDMVVRKPNDETLSSKLAQSGGVICPPAVDPEIRAPTPEAGRTPVIPPPGSPGGNPQVQPK
ncbi:hypothetical protein [Undibacter mobilis]|uniref:Uncharacterized protein n=1 Tax=Undibacter mobilis TaxID=2292256 RepID=A0A371BE35_9BRAD|nr:hypothetical protein [Undibacter mobilis]RDV05621.1 hypothetical protein DXH78_00400 [Undibacter mobilis]